MNDLIERQKAINAIFNEITSRRMNREEPMDEFRAEAILTKLSRVEQRTGRWIEKTQETECQRYNECSCSECGTTLIYIEGRHKRYPYCPNCGAKMEVEHDNT